MGIKAESSIEFKGFQGMASNLDPRDLKTGQAQVQVNVAVLRPGELTLRRGLRELTFDTDNA